MTMSKNTINLRNKGFRAVINTVVPNFQIAAFKFVIHHKDTWGQQRILVRFQPSYNCSIITASI